MLWGFSPQCLDPQPQTLRVDGCGPSSDLVSMSDCRRLCIASDRKPYSPCFLVILLSVILSEFIKACSN